LSKDTSFYTSFRGQVVLDATAEDDRGPLTFQWTQVSGPGTVTFGDATAKSTTVDASTDGTYVLRLTVTDAAGNSAFDELILTWDTTAPEATIASGLPAAYTQGVALDATVGGAGVTHYRYKARLTSADHSTCSDSTGYSGATDVAQKIVEDLSSLDDGTVRLCLIGRDVVGNWQSFASATSYTWTKDTIPPVPGGPLRHEAVTPVSVTMGWDEASDELTPTANLEYRTCFAQEADDLSNAEDMFGPNCTLAQDWTAASTSAGASGLVSKTMYYWRTAVRDQAGNVALYDLKAQNTNPVLHVAYSVYKVSTPYLAHAENSSGSFVNSVVDTKCSDAEGSCGVKSLILDADNKPHLSYYGRSAKTFYANKVSGSWSTPEVASGTTSTKFNSLAIDADGKAHIGVYDSYNQDMRYLTNTSGSWAGYTVHAANDTGQHPAILIDPSNNLPILVWHAYSTRRLMYSACTAGDCKTAGDWTTPVARESLMTPGTGEYSSMVMDDNGYLHISYIEGSQTLRYMTNAPNGTWLSTGVPIASKAHRNNISVMVKDGATTVDIVYRSLDPNNKGLMNATCSSGCTNADNWTIVRINTKSLPHEYQLGFDRDKFGNLHVTYHDVDHPRLFYQKRINGVWDSEPTLMDGGTGHGYHSSAKVER
jgi:hypothetical protein